MSSDFFSLTDRRLAYQRQLGDKNFASVFFLSGFGSDMEGSKASFLADRCAQENVSFLRFDYRGCGQSSGSFTEATLNEWLADSLVMLDQQTEGPQIIVGSSMGGWIGLLLAKRRPERFRAFVGIAAAPDFTEDLIWGTLTSKQKDILLKQKVIYDEKAPPDKRLPFTLAMVEAGRKHLIFKEPLKAPFPVRLLQGLSDSDVPWEYAPRIANHIDGANVRVTLVKGADHSLSSPEHLELLWQTIAAFL
ncbi:MAG: alpha/beta hydrolase [Alphaproteobacteria bacterium]|nr:alpha/beta hydrolase [Alphaproteobacteria bacterium]